MAALALGSCGGDGGDDGPPPITVTPSPTPSPVPSPTPTPSPTPSPTPAPSPSPTPTPTATPSGAEFRVNTAAVAEAPPSVASIAGGGFVVVWQSTENGGDVKAQLFAGDGSKQAGEFRVSADAAGAQTAPSVASLDSGGFVVAWNANGDVKSQAFTAAGQRSGAEFTVDLPDYPAEVTSGGFLSERSPEAADLPGPGYVLAWAFEDRERQIPPSGVPTYNVNAYRVQAQLVSDAGAARGGVVDALGGYLFFRGRVDVAGLATGGGSCSLTRARSAPWTASSRP